MPKVKCDYIVYRMVKYYHEPLDHIFFALADRTRRAMLMELRKGVRTAKELAEPFALSLPAISKHLKVLEKAHLIRRRIEGRHHFFDVQTDPIKEAWRWGNYYLSFWDSNLDQLADYLDTEEQNESQS